MALHMPGMRDSKAVANFYFRYKLLASTLFPRSGSEMNISSAYIDDDFVNSSDSRRAKRRCVRRGEAMLSAMAADCDFTSDSSYNDKDRGDVSDGSTDRILNEHLRTDNSEPKPTSVPPMKRQESSDRFPSKGDRDGEGMVASL